MMLMTRPIARAVLTCALTTLLACNNGNDNEPENPTAPTPPGPQVSYTALGASDAIGAGGSVVCIPLVACPDGTGYVPSLARRLRSEGKTVALVNLGIPGAVLSPGVQSLGNSLGRDIFANILERELPFVPRESTLVTVFTGANDANTMGAAVEAGRGGSDPVGYIDGQIRSFGTDFATLISGLRGRAPTARIIVLNLPNLAGLPYMTGASAIRRQGLQRLAVGISAQINTAASGGFSVIDLMCDARSYTPGFYSSDGFHPNDAGYAFLTDLIHAAVNAGSTPAPRASCPPMTLVP
jgi:lysophospholipase L1-like esterase